ncbi:hypothetical protein LCGC14_2610550 [marine sediment metagenome]|nr:hypothetical protein [Pseudoalteromonas prydzensis]
MKISDAQRCPFTSVGYVKTQQKRLLESCWLTAKKKQIAQRFTQPNLEQLVSLLSDDISPAAISQACIEIMANLPQNINLIFINNLLNEPSLHNVAKLVVRKVLLQQHSYNLIALIDLQTLYFAFSTSQNPAVQTLAKSELTILVDSQSDIKNLITGFNFLCQSELVNSPLMSLFLLSLSWEQVNAIGNHASRNLPTVDVLQVLLQSGFVKLLPLVNASLNKIENPSSLIALMRRMLGDKLDLLVDFETQISAWQGEQQACADFKQQLQLNWPKYEEQLASLRLIAGNALNAKLNAIEISAMDCYSQAVFNLHRYYQHLAAKKLNAGVPA